MLIVVLGFVGFIAGYDLALIGFAAGAGQGAVAPEPRSDPRARRWPTFVVVLGGFAAAAMSDRISRLTVMQLGVILSTLCTLLILLAQDFQQLFDPAPDHRHRARDLRSRRHSRSPPS